MELLKFNIKHKCIIDCKVPKQPCIFALNHKPTADITDKSSYNPLTIIQTFQPWRLIIRVIGYKTETL